MVAPPPDRGYEAALPRHWYRVLVSCDHTRREKNLSTRKLYPPTLSTVIVLGLAIVFFEVR